MLLLVPTYSACIIFSFVYHLKKWPRNICFEMKFDPASFHRRHAHQPAKEKSLRNLDERM